MKFHASTHYSVVRLVLDIAISLLHLLYILVVQNVTNPLGKRNVNFFKRMHKIARGKKRFHSVS